MYKPRGLFATNNYAVYFYLIGSLMFFFASTRMNERSFHYEMLLLSILVILSYVLVYYVQPNYKI